MIDFWKRSNVATLNKQPTPWLVTNGTGEFASGTSQVFPHQPLPWYLIAALQPPLGRTLLVTNWMSNHLSWSSLILYSVTAGKVEKLYPNGFTYIERFHLDGTMPVLDFCDIRYSPGKTDLDATGVKHKLYFLPLDQAASPI